MSSTSSSKPSSAPIPSEDIIARKFDACAADLLVKSGLGFSVGVVASVVLFRRRAWPTFLGLGFGAGQAYNNCDRLFNPYSLPGTKALSVSNVASPIPSSSSSSSTSPASSPAPSSSSKVEPKLV